MKPRDGWNVADPYEAFFKIEETLLDNLPLFQPPADMGKNAQRGNVMNNQAFTVDEDSWVTTKI